MSFDSSPAALAAQRETWQRLGPAGRVRVAGQLSEDVRSVAVAGMRARQPGLSAQEARRAALDRAYLRTWASTLGVEAQLDAVLSG